VPNLGFFENEKNFGVVRELSPNLRREKLLTFQFLGLALLVSTQSHTTFACTFVDDDVSSWYSNPRLCFVAVPGDGAQGFNS
jgi:hypothetical protein